jgi:glucan endo-1,6-beta-glucosidase
MQIQALLFLASAALVTAWLPGVHKNITATDGANLFHATPWTSSTSRSVTGRRATKRWLPASGKIRGVNLGSMFVFEPWIAENEWNSMGCGPYKSEFDCVSGLGQEAANVAFQNHWNTWITQSDIAQMQSYGLNTIRIPVGYWMREDIVYSNSEYFPQGGIAYLEQLCGWASDAGFYIIIDLHGAPGAQVAENPDTGQVSHASPPTLSFF